MFISCLYCWWSFVIFLNQHPFLYSGGEAIIKVPYYFSVAICVSYALTWVLIFTRGKRKCLWLCFIDLLTNPISLVQLYLNEIFSVWPAEIILMLLNHCMPTPFPLSRCWRWEAFDFHKEAIFLIFSCVIENATENIFQLFSQLFPSLKHIYNKEIRNLDKKIL